MEAGSSRALPARRAGVRLELCTHSRATPCLGNRLGQGAFVDWQDGWVQRLCQPIPLFSFQTWLAISFFLEASEPAPSHFPPFGPLCTHLTPGRSHCMCFRHQVLFPLRLQQLDHLLSLCTAGAVFSESPLAAIWRVLLSISSGLFIKRLWGTVTERWNFSFKILAKPLNPLCFILSILRATTMKHFQVFYEN